MAEQVQAASKALKNAIEIEKESQQPQGSEVSDHDFELLADLATRLNDRQREKLISIMLLDNSTTWEDVGDEDCSERGQPTKKGSPPKARPVTQGQRELQSRPHIPRMLFAPKVPELARHDLGDHVYYELTQPPHKKKLILGWHLKCPTAQQRFLIQIREGDFNVPQIFGSEGTAITDVTWEKIVLNLDRINQDVKRLYGRRKDRAWAF